MSRHCVILMASFNGKRYIGKQIDSIINQTFKDWRLFIRDDGSNDGTIEAIEKYCALDRRIRLICNDTGRHGAYLNFFTLIGFAQKYDPFDYYFFADQDDIWFEDKLQKMMDAAEESEYSMLPLLVYSDMQVIDGEDNLVYPSLDAVMGISEIGTHSLFFTHGFLWGCDVMVNRQLFELVPCLPLDHPFIDIVSHDNYFGKFALSFGKILYIKKPSIKHRRHDDNTTGGYKMKLNPIAVLNKVLFHYSELAKTHARVYNQTLVAVNQMEKHNLLTKETAKVRDVIVRGGLKSVLWLQRHTVKRKQFSRTVGLYMVMLLKSYKKYICSQNQK